MIRTEVLKALEEVLASARQQEKNKALFQSEAWDRAEYHLKRARSSLELIQAGTDGSDFAAFDFDVSIAELMDFIKENSL